VKKFGIASERIGTKGYGFSKPIASNKTKAGKAKNRRIETNFTCND
jgi:OOP family OmpA-OmpF porin